MSIASIAAIVDIVTDVINVAAQAAAIGKDIRPTAELLVSTLRGDRDVTQEELAALQAQAAALNAELDAPIPDEQP